MERYFSIYRERQDLEILILNQDSALTNFLPQTSADIRRLYPTFYVVLKKNAQQKKSTCNICLCTPSNLRFCKMFLNDT